MPTCPICGSEDFELQDGHYFCNECSTQSQEIREEKDDEEVAYQKGVRHKRIKSSHNRVSAKKKRVAEDSSPTWYTCEALNILLYHQVEALIELGTSPRLKNIVMDLWFAYLKSCEQAFSSNEEDFVPRLSSFPYYRDILVFRSGKPVDPLSLKTMRRQFRHAYRYHLKGQLAKRKKEYKPKCFKNIEMKLLAENSEVEASESGIEEKCEKFCLSNLKHYSKMARKNIKAHGVGKLWCKTNKEICPERLSMRKTVAFCYAGLLLLQEQIIPGDIARWIREGRIPYLNAYRLMPEGTKLTFLDRFFVKSIHVPNVVNVMEETKKLLYHLKVKQLPPQPVEHLAVRFVMDLNLPNEVASVIHRLVKDICPKLSAHISSWHAMNKRVQAHIPRYDIQAAALVVIAMKLVFGLDGKTERVLSIRAREVNDQSQIGRQVFVWDEWEEQAKLNLNLQKCKNVSSNIYSAKEAIDVGMLHAFCKETKLREDSKNIVDSRATEKTRTIHKAFTPLFQEKNLAFPCASSFPLRTSQNVSGEHEVTFFLRDFSSHTLPRKAFEGNNFNFGITPRVNREFSHLEKFVECLPSSQRVLLNCLCTITDEPFYLLIWELHHMEVKLFKLLGKKWTSKGKVTPTSDSVSQ